MAIVTQDGKYSYVNTRYGEMVGSTSWEARLCRKWESVSVRDTQSGSTDDIRTSMQKDRRWLGVINVTREPGESIPVELAVTALPEGGVVLLSRDLREWRKAEHARTEAEIKYRRIVEQVAAISYIAEHGVTGRWYYVSPQIQSILGYTPEEWLEDSENWLRHIHPDDHAAVNAAEAAGLQGKSFQAEDRATPRNRRSPWIT